MREGEGEVVVYVWHNCMGCLIKGLENYLTWYYLVNEKRKIIVLSKKDVENNKRETGKILDDVDVLISSCSSFELSDTWEAFEKILGEKRWFVVHKPCELGPKQHFRNTETYKFLSNKNVTHIDENYILKLNKM